MIRYAHNKIKDVEMKKKVEEKELNKKIYKEPISGEVETTINVLYEEELLSIYTNKVDLQRELFKILGEPCKEYKKGRSIVASIWNIPLGEKSKISKIVLKANIFEL